MKNVKKTLAMFLAVLLLISVIGFDVQAEVLAAAEEDAIEESLLPETGETGTTGTEPTEREPSKTPPSETPPTEEPPTEPAPTEPPLLTPPTTGPPAADDEPLIEDEVLEATDSFVATSMLMGTADVGIMQNEGEPIVLIEIQKIWVDVPEGETPIAEFELYADGVYVGTRSLNYPDSMFFWTGLPYYQGDGETKIDYEVVELLIPFYDRIVESMESIIESAIRITPNNHMTWTQSPYLSYFITMLTQGDGFAVWTLSHVPDDQKQDFLDKVMAKASNLGPFQNATLANTQWFEGASLTFNPGPGTITVDYEIVDGQVSERSITFQDPSTWTQFIYGTHSYLKYIFRNTHIGGFDPVTITFSGRKILSGRDLGAEEFEFELYESDETGAEGDFVSSTVNLSDGSFVFDPIVYPFAEIEGTYYFLIKEVDGALPAVTYDDSEFLVTATIEVITNGVSTVNVSVNYRKILGEGEFGPPVALEFYNAYVPLDAETSIAGRKVLDGRELEEEEFEFALFEADAMGVVPEGALPLMTTSNFGQSWSFPLVYPQGSDGTYYYVVREIDNELGGVTYDESDLFYAVEVWDDMEGQMMVMIVESPEVPVFYNEFEPEPAYAAIRGLKELQGRELEDDEFEFALYEADSEGVVAEGAEPIQITGNQGINWMFILSYDDPGTYYYVVREIPADDDDDDGFIVYDDSEFFFEVMVWESDGSLFTQVGSPIDREFNNRYVRPDIEVEKMVEETTFSNVGDMLHYSFSVKNTGNVPLVKLIVNDEKLGIEDLVIELSEALEVGETFVFEFSEPYVVTAADIEDADPIENTLTVMAETEDGYSAEDSDEAIVAFEMRLPLPPTGEAISYWHVIALMALAAVAIGTAVLYRRKRVKSQGR